MSRAATSRRPIVFFRIHSPTTSLLTQNKSPSAQERGLLVEINNGRLAMLGIFGFLAESKIPGSVPALRLGLGF